MNQWSTNFYETFVAVIFSIGIDLLSFLYRLIITNRSLFPFLVLGKEPNISIDIISDVPFSGNNFRCFWYLYTAYLVFAHYFQSFTNFYTSLYMWDQ